MVYSENQKEKKNQKITKMTMTRVSAPSILLAILTLSILPATILLPGASAVVEEESEVVVEEESEVVVEETTQRQSQVIEQEEEEEEASVEQEPEEEEEEDSEESEDSERRSASLERADEAIHEFTDPEDDIEFHQALCLAGISTEALDELGGCEALPPRD
jgi:membrane protein involved in colicin uptake